LTDPIAYGSLLLKESNKPTSRIALTLRFSEIQFGFHKYRYLGLIQGELYVAAHIANLTLALTNCKAPEDDWSFNDTPALKVSVEQKAATSSKHDSSSEGSVGASVEVDLAGGAKAKPTAAKKNVRAQGEQFALEQTATKEHYLIVPIGSELNPRWLIESAFKNKDGASEPLLGPILNAASFCGVCLTGSPAKVELLLTVPPHGLSVRGEAGVFGSVNKKTLGRLRLLRHFGAPLKLDELLMPANDHD